VWLSVTQTRSSKSKSLNVFASSGVGFVTFRRTAPVQARQCLLKKPFQDQHPPRQQEQQTTLAISRLEFTPSLYQSFSTNQTSPSSRIMCTSRRVIHGACTHSTYAIEFCSEATEYQWQDRFACMRRLPCLEHRRTPNICAEPLAGEGVPVHHDFCDQCLQMLLQKLKTCAVMQRGLGENWEPVPDMRFFYEDL